MRIRRGRRRINWECRKKTEGFKVHLDHEQYNKSGKEPNSRNQALRQEYASGSVTNGQSEGLSVVLH